jgi:hypothetical protein
MFDEMLVDGFGNENVVKGKRRAIRTVVGIGKGTEVQICC